MQGDYKKCGQNDIVHQSYNKDQKSHREQTITAAILSCYRTSKMIHNTKRKNKTHYRSF